MAGVSSGKGRRGAARGLLLAGVALGGCGIARPVIAQPAAAGAAAQRTYSIPAGPLGAAMAAFGETSGLRVIALTEVVAGRRTVGVSGPRSSEAALRELLAGTGLSYRLEDGTVTLAAAQSTAAAPLPVVRTGLDPDTIELEPVNVTAQRGIPATATIGPPPPPYAGGQVATGGRLGLLGNRNIFDTPFSQTNYTEEFIRNQQARTLSDLLEADPSVRSLSPRFADEEEISIRGFKISTARALFNGLPGIFSDRRGGLEGIERVEVLRGPGALLYNTSPHGSTLGGLINLVPKRAGDLPLTRVTGNFASRSELGGQLDVGRRFGPDNRAGMRVNLAGSSGGTEVDNTAQRFFTGTLGADYRGDRWRASIDVVREDRTIDGITRAYGFASEFAVPRAPSARRNPTPSYADFSTENTFGVANVEYDVAQDWTVYGAVGVRRSENRYFGPIFLTLPDSSGNARISSFNGAFGFRNESGIVGVRGIAQTGPVRHQLNLSVDRTHREVLTSGYEGTSFDTNIYSPAVLPRVDPRNNRRISSRTSEETFTSYAVADTLSVLNERVALTVGVRYQDLDVSNYDPSTDTRTDRYSQGRVSPAAALVVKPTPRLTLYTNYIEDLFSAGTAPVNAANAGQQLAPLVGTQVEVGAKYDFGRFAVTGALFQITQPAVTLDAGTNVFSASGEQRNRGIELGVLGEPVPGWRALGGITLLEGRLTKASDPANAGKVAPAAPRFQATLGLEHDLAFVPGLTLTGRVVHVGSQYVNQANTQRIPDWTRFDVGARYAFRLASKPVVARFAIQNLADRSFWLSANDGQLTINTPRTYLFSLSADF